MNHTLSVIVEDKPGVLARVSSLLARRGFNIHSLAVGPSHEEGMSRMTIVVDAPEVEQVKKLAILDHDLTIENGDLTPSLKVKRNVVHEKYADIYDGLYAS